MKFLTVYGIFLSNSNLNDYFKKYYNVAYLFLHMWFISSSIPIHRGMGCLGITQLPFLCTTKYRQDCLRTSKCKIHLGQCTHNFDTAATYSEGYTFSSCHRMATSFAKCIRCQHLSVLRIHHQLRMR